MTTTVIVLTRGVAIGLMYGVVALGFVVVYRATRVLNFAHGALGAAGAVIMASMVGDGGLGIERWRGANPLGRYADTVTGWAANLALAALLAALLALVVERVAIRPMLGRAQFSLLLVTIGASIPLQMYADRSPIPRHLHAPWSTGAIGVIQTAAGRLLSGYIGILGAGYPAILPYVLAVVVLAVRPTGLFGTRDVQRI